MTHSIDVTGLAPEVVLSLESLVAVLREKTATPAIPADSVFDLFGKAPTLRSAEDIAKQCQEERDAWGER
jgi:hypothetical protein